MADPNKINEINPLTGFEFDSPGDTNALIRKGLEERRIGHIVCTDVRTGRNIVVTGFDHAGLPLSSFAPAAISETFMVYDQ